MTQIDKLLSKFKKGPDSVSYRDLERILLSLGFEKINTKGSHVKFKKEGLISDIVIPVHKNECKDFYKKQTYKQIKNLL